jgi:hypothetical protein
MRAAVSCRECERLDREEALATREFVEAEEALKAAPTKEWEARKARRDKAEKALTEARNAAFSHRRVHWI